MACCRRCGRPCTPPIAARPWPMAMMRSRRDLTARFADAFRARGGGLSRLHRHRGQCAGAGLPHAALRRGPVPPGQPHHDVGMRRAGILFRRQADRAGWRGRQADAGRPSPTRWRDWMAACTASSPASSASARPRELGTVYTRRRNCRDQRTGPCARLEAAHGRRAFRQRRGASGRHARRSDLEMRRGRAVFRRHQGGRAGGGGGGVFRSRTGGRVRISPQAGRSPGVQDALRLRPAGGHAER